VQGPAFETNPSVNSEHLQRAAAAGLRECAVERSQIPVVEFKVCIVVDF